MFWPKQMYDRNTSPNPRWRKSKEQIVLSTCVGYGQKTPPNPDSFLLGLHNKKEHCIFYMNSPVHQLLWMSSCQATETLHTSLLSYFAATAWTLQCRPIDHTGIYCWSYGLYQIIWTLIQQQTEDPLCAQYSQLLFLASIWPVTLSHRRQNSWTVSKQNPIADCSQQANEGEGRRQECCFHVNAANERNSQKVLKPESSLSTVRGGLSF